MLTASEADALLDLAERSIGAGLDGHGPVVPSADALPDALRAVRGAFVTLHVRGELNGCIGTIVGTAPLCAEVARLAWSSAFEDPRLPPLRASDLDALDVEVSVLSDLEQITASSRVDVLAQLEPARHGLLIKAQGRQAVFLPSVWDQVRDGDEFLDLLLRKAALSPRVWPRSVGAWRFTVDKFARRFGATRAA